MIDGIVKFNPFKGLKGGHPESIFKRVFYLLKIRNMNQIIEWSKGNPGAMTFLMEFLKPGNEIYGIISLPKLEKLNSIRGTNLYVLWSDLCNKDLNKVARLCERCPDSILEDACSRQDYSGRKLIEPYL